MHVLADFLNHGILPFVGREREVARIMEFWRGCYEATSLRTMLLTGEAGIGKSRLLEHAMRRITGSGGCVVHVKFYPESAASLHSLLVRSLLHPFAGRGLIGDAPAATQASVGGALRRLARLRPTLLVLEDLHLLAGEALGDLSRLLHALADETISLAGLARPVELEARAILEPYLVEEAVIPELTAVDCASIWQMIAGANLEPDVAAALHAATAGNPLALRSALRGAMNRSDGHGAPARIDAPGRIDAPARIDAPGGVLARANAATLARAVHRTVGLLADGMTAHLRREELAAAKALAALGEVFAREAASALLDDAEAALQALMFKGIVATAVAPPDPLPGSAGAGPALAFTHTLLHRHLIASPAFDADRLVRTIAESPLYSILPFRLLAESPLRSLDADALRRAFDRTIDVQIAINNSGLWQSAEHTWRTAVHLASARLGGWPQADWERMLVRLLNHKLNMVRREPEAVRVGWLAQLSALSASPATEEMATGRLYELFHRNHIHSAEHPEVVRATWDEAERLIAARPGLRLTYAYAGFVVATGVAARSHDDTGMLRRIEQRAVELLETEELPDRVRRMFERRVRPPLLLLYDDADELRLRLEQAREIEQTVEPSDLGVWNFCIGMLAETAMVEQLERACRRVFPSMMEQDMPGVLAAAVATQQRVAGGTADSLAEALHAFDEAVAGIPEWRRPRIVGTLAVPLVDAALLRGEPADATAIIDRYDVADLDLRPVHGIFRALDAADPGAALAEARSGNTFDSGFASLIDLAVNGNAITPDRSSELDDAVTRALDFPLLRLTDVLTIRAAARLVAIAATPPDPAAAAAIGTAIERALEWLGAPERRLFIYMRAVLRDGGPSISDRAASAWEKKIGELAADHGGRTQPTADRGRVKLSMLGTIAARMPDGTQQRIQGARAKMLLAMMTANAMLETPLPSAEFCRLAAGSDVIEIENARDIVKTTVHRLRQNIGRAAVITSASGSALETGAPAAHAGGAPRLNTDLVDVDLLDAHRLLLQAREALLRPSPMQAKGALVAALEIAGGEVPFPSLYDEFIEEAREDFENMLRTTTLDVARALEREGGTGDSVEILRRAADALPGDGEITEMLHRALVQSGRRTEAERLRRNAEDE